MLKTVAQLARPFNVILAFLTYFFGTGVARYLGYDILPVTPLMLLWIVLLQVASAWLTEYFRGSTEPLPGVETPHQREALRVLLMQVSAAALTLLAALTVLLLVLKVISPQSGLLMGFSFVLLLAYAVPPVRLIDHGFGELAQAIFLATVVPALAFLQHTADLSRLLSLLTFPLTLIALAYLLVLDFPTFSKDVKYERRTLLFRLGWQRAMFLHNVLLLVAFAQLAVYPFIDVPLALVWPGFLTFPLALYQLFMLRNIALGVKPLWNVLTANGAAIFILTTYLLTLTFWLR